MGGNLETRLLDGANVDWALKFFYSEDAAPFRHHNLLVQGDLTLQTEPWARTSVNTKEWKDLIANVWFTNKPATLAHNVTFSSGLHLLGPSGFEARGRLNGVNLVGLKRRYASRAKDQDWTGNVILQGNIQF